MGFKEIDHTADWAILVWGENYESLFIHAAQGMYSLMGIQPNLEDKKTISLALGGEDQESLLVAFLSELLYLTENENIIFETFNLEFEEGTVIAQLEGHGIQSLQKMIKAVTFHNLEINRINGLVQTEIVFDV